MDGPQVGQRAADFELPEASGDPFRLFHLLRDGPVVLLFYPSDWGWVCNSEMKAFMDLQPQFESVGARLVAISTNSAISHRAWKEMLGLRFPILSDFNGEVCRRYSLPERTTSTRGWPSARSSSSAPREGSSTNGSRRTSGSSRTTTGSWGPPGPSGSAGAA